MAEEEEHCFVPPQLDVPVFGRDYGVRHASGFTPSPSRSPPYGGGQETASPQSPQIFSANVEEEEEEEDEQDEQEDVAPNVLCLSCSKWREEDDAAMAGAEDDDEEITFDVEAWVDAHEDFSFEDLDEEQVDEDDRESCLVDVELEGNTKAAFHPASWNPVWKRGHFWVKPATGGNGKLIKKTGHPWDAPCFKIVHALCPQLLHKEGQTCVIPCCQVGMFLRFYLCDLSEKKFKRRFLPGGGPDVAAIQQYLSEQGVLEDTEAERAVKKLKETDEHLQQQSLEFENIKREFLDMKRMLQQLSEGGRFISEDNWNVLKQRFGDVAYMMEKMDVGDRFVVGQVVAVCVTAQGLEVTLRPLVDANVQCWGVVANCDFVEGCNMDVESGWPRPDIQCGDLKNPFRLDTARGVPVVVMGVAAVKLVGSPPSAQPGSCVVVNYDGTGPATTNCVSAEDAGLVPMSRFLGSIARLQEKDSTVVFVRINMGDTVATVVESVQSQIVQLQEGHRDLKNRQDQLVSRVDVHDEEIAMVKRQVSALEIQDQDRRSWRELGNEAFRAQKYEEAVQHYSRGIESNDPDMFKLLTNRSLCYRKLKMLHPALCDAQAASILQPLVLRGHQRKAEVCKELGAEFLLQGVCATARGLCCSNNAAQAVQLLLKCYPQTKGRVVVVAPGDSLQQVIDRAPPNTVIVVKGNATWRLEQVLLRKPVMLCGMGNDVRIDIHSSLTVACQGVYIEDITFRSLDGVLPGVLVVQGGLQARFCEFSSEIRTQRFPVVNAQQNSRLLLEDCRVVGCETGGGVLSVGGSEATLRRCVIRDVAAFGMEVRLDASAVLEDCTIFHCGTAGVACTNRQGRSRCRVELRNCKIYDNVNEGVIVQFRGHAVLNDCLIHHNGKFGVTAQEPGTDVRIRKCRLLDNRFWGVTISGGANVNVSDCAISYNWCGGIHLGYNYRGSVKLTRNLAEHNRGKWFRSLCEEDPHSDMDFSHLSPQQREEQGMPAGETRRWTRAAVLSPDNSSTLNGELQQHPARPTCAWCSEPCRVEESVNCEQCHVKWCGPECRDAHRSIHMLTCNVVSVGHLQVIISPMSVGKGGEQLISIAIPNPGTPYRVGNPPELGSWTIIKVQTNANDADQNQRLGAYDASRTIRGGFRSPQVWALIMTQGKGILGRNGWTSKKIFLHARWIRQEELKSMVLLDLSQLAKWQDW